jgi:hypothetical protein
MKIIESNNQTILNLPLGLTITNIKTKYSDNNIFWFEIEDIKQVVISEEINIFVDSIILNGMENCQIKEINNLSLEGYTTPPEE